MAILESNARTHHRRGRMVSNSDGKYDIHTDDNFMIHAGNANPNDRTLVEYDVKIKNRMDGAVRHP